MAEHVRPGAQMDVTDLKHGELADAQPGGDGELEHRVVTPSGPGRLVRRCQQRGDLRVDEIAELVAGLAFWWDGQDPPDGGQVFWVVARCVGEERMHRGQSGVSGGDAVGALGFQIGEESVDQVRVELGQVQLCRRGSRSFVQRSPAAGARCRGRRRRCADWPRTGWSAGW